MEYSENSSQILICRLCLKIIGGECVPVNPNLLKKIECVSMEMLNSIPKDSIICQTCEESLEKYCRLKYQVCRTGETCSTNDIEKNEHGLNKGEDSTWKDKSSRELKHVSHKGSNCRICDKPPIADTSKYYFLKETSEKLSCLLCFGISTNSHICEGCAEIINELTSFKYMCMNTQETIFDYCKEFSLENSSDIDLLHVRFHQTYSTDNSIHNFSNNAGNDNERNYNRKKDPYNCDHCSSTSSRKNQFNTHLRIHENPAYEKMFKCHKCKYQTNYKPRLRIHLLVHEKPEDIPMFKCNECSYEARQKGNLKTHIRRKHMQHQQTFE